MDLWIANSALEKKKKKRKELFQLSQSNPTGCPESANCARARCHDHAAGLCAYRFLGTAQPPVRVNDIVGIEENINWPR